MPSWNTRWQEEYLSSSNLHLGRCLAGPASGVQYFMDRLRIDESIGSYIKQDKRMNLSTERTLSGLIHNVLATARPM